MTHEKGDAIMFCPKCGVRVNDSQRFCKRCGAKVNRLQKDDVDAATANDSSEGSQEKKAPSKTSIVPIANARSKKPHEVGLSTDEEVPSEKSEDSEKANAAEQDAGAVSQIENAKPGKSPTSSPMAKPTTPPIADGLDGQGGVSRKPASPKRRRISPMAKLTTPPVADGLDGQGGVARKPASPKRRRNTVVAIASGSLAAVILAVAVFLMAGPVQHLEAEAPTVCTKATRVSPSDETGKVLNSYKVSLIDRKTGKEVSSRQLKKSDGFALGDFEDENGQPISDGDYMLRYEDMESGNIYDGRYIDVRDGDSAAVASTTGITGSSDERLYSDKKEIERLNQELQGFSVREQQMKDEQAALYAENEGLKAELGAAVQKNGEYEAVIEAGAAELETKQKTIDEQGEKLEKAEGEIDALKAEVEEKQKQIDSLKEEPSNSSDKHADEELAKKQEEIESLKAEIGKKQGEIDGLKKRVEELEAGRQGNAGGNAADGESEDDELDHEGAELDDEGSEDGEASEDEEE